MQGGLPKIGEPVPLVVRGAAAHPPQTCASNPPRRDPCATVRIRGISFTVAWDEKTELVTYLFTNDVHFITDGGLIVGGECNLAAHNAPVSYVNWLVTPLWSDTARHYSADAKWYALLEKKDEEHGIIRGFVQSPSVESRFLTVRAPEY